MDKEQVIAILDNPTEYSTADRKTAAMKAIAILDGIAEKEESEQPHYHFVMFGSEGLEGYIAVRSEKEISDNTLKSMELRARINSQRKISGYAFKANMKVDPEMITKDLLSRAVKIF